MYHYVRPIAESRWPGIKGLELSGFERQLQHLTRHHTIVSLGDVARCVGEKRPLPASPAVLTFDDGYRDHYRHVFPVLRRLGIPGTFFPAFRPVVERRMLDVNKIHFVLASGAGANPERLIADIEDEIGDARGEFDLRPLAEYRERYWAANRFDAAEVIYIKRLLQVALPETLRSRIADRLFRGCVSLDEESFADDLYMTRDELGEMSAAGMEIGSHGYSHRWLNALNEAEQARDIDLSLDFLESVGSARDTFLFCYPYGGYDKTTLALLAARGCRAAVTTQVRRADLELDGPLELPRLDTNDFPKDDAAALGPGQPT